MSNYSPIVNYAAKDALSSGDPLKRIKGTEISAEFTAIATMSTTKADLASPTFTGTPSAPTAAPGTNTTQLATTAFVAASFAPIASPTFTGEVTMPRWSVTGSTVPVNGMYLPSANTLGWATNTTARGTLNATGNWSLLAPSAGVALSVAGFSTQNVLALSSASSNTNLISATDGTCTSIWNHNGASGMAIGPTSNHPLTLFTNNTGRVSVAAAGNVTINAPASGIALTVNGFSGTHSAKIADSATNSFNAGFLEAPQNSQAANYTTVLSDSGKHLYHSGGVAHTHTIDSNANVPYPLGTVLTFINENGAANLTIALTSDTLRFAPGGTTGSRTLAANGRATAIKVTSTGWQISGTNLT